jgi:hypothetical protein
MSNNINSNWQAFDTAPKDGTVILVLLESNSGFFKPSLMFYGSTFYGSDGEYFLTGKSDWFHCFGSETKIDSHALTRKYWMPVPSDGFAVLGREFIKTSAPDEFYTARIAQLEQQKNDLLAAFNNVCSSAQHCEGRSNEVTVMRIPSDTLRSARDCVLKVEQEKPSQKHEVNHERHY